MAKLHLVCDNCDSTAFRIQKIAGHYNDKYECVCSECDKPIATIDNYSINWITEEEKADDSDPTA